MPSRYRYTGPLTAISLVHGQQFLLHTGLIYELPPQDPATQQMLACGHLHLIKE